jgi:hypothetical protein
MKNIVKGVAVVILLAIIAYAVWYGKQKRAEPLPVERPMTFKSTRVSAGALPFDGRLEKWSDISRFVVCRTASLVPASSPAAATWTEVRMAHDGTDLYLRISMNMDIEQVIRGSGGIGNIYVDSDNNPDTGQEESDGTKTYGYDWGLQFMPGLGRKPGESGGPPSISWFLVKCDKKISKADLASRTCSLDKPDSLAFKGQFIEFKYPLEALHISPPCKASFSFQPTGLHDAIIYTIDFE